MTQHVSVGWELVGSEVSVSCGFFVRSRPGNARAVKPPPQRTGARPPPPPHPAPPPNHTAALNGDRPEPWPAAPAAPTLLLPPHVPNPWHLQCLRRADDRVSERTKGPDGLSNRVSTQLPHTCRAGGGRVAPAIRHVPQREADAVVCCVQPGASLGTGI